MLVPILRTNLNQQQLAMALRTLQTICPAHSRTVVQSKSTSHVNCARSFHVRVADSSQTRNAKTTHRTARTRNIHASPRRHRQANHASKKDQFTRSPFARRPTVHISDEFFVRRELREDDEYGVRRYLLLPRTDDSAAMYDSDNVIASLNANRNVLFGARLHAPTHRGEGDDEDDLADYLAATGPLLDIAREDAAINGQQVQALATLNGLCSWVRACLEKEGEGSDVLTGLLHGEQTPSTDTRTSDRQNKAPIGKRSNLTITGSSYGLPKRKADRVKLTEAIRAIATGEPRPGHSVVGVGTYRDGKSGWMALAREYASGLDPSREGKNVQGELALYRSRGGEVTSIEHLAHTEPEYLREAGGAMARIFFV